MILWPLSFLFVCLFPSPSALLLLLRFPMLCVSPSVLTMLKCFPSILSVFRTFDMKGCLISVKRLFLHLWSCDLCPRVHLCSLHFLLCIDYIDKCIDPSLNLWNKPDLTMVSDLFDVFLNSVCIIRSCCLVLPPRMEWADYKGLANEESFTLQMGVPILKESRIISYG